MSNIPTLAITGRNKAARIAAYGRIADLSYSEAQSRGEALANMRVALGTSPSEAEVKAAKLRHVIGRVAQRLPGKGDQAKRIERATDLVLHYAKPAQEGKAARKLRAGQKGRRTIAEQKLVRAAEEATSVFFAELSLSNAKTNAQRNASKASRAPAPAGSTNRGKAGDATPPAHSVLVKPEKPATGADYVQHVQTQLAALLAYDNKHAKVRPIEYSAVADALAALKQLANKAANEYGVRMNKEAAAKKD